ncbi:MAG: tetratricopeptide repeat protein [Candidatus Marinimicrobia bacterium]|nr:tetratricopeptide repeat protein [Candidatus Neomarinimicrobiota bacterium]
MKVSLRFHTMVRSLLWIIGIVIFFITACVPPPAAEEETADKEQAYLDSLRKVKCPRLMSSAAEYYKNRDWKSATLMYKKVVELGCDEGQEEEVFPYWAIAHENLGNFDSSEYVLLQGLKRLPDNLNLRKRLAYAYKRKGDVEKEIMEYEKILDLVPEDIESMTSLSDLYAKVDRYGDQIDLIKKILVIEPNNREAQGDLTIAYKKTGKDPLDIYRKRFEDNPGDLSLGLDLAEQLMSNNEYEEAILVLSQMMRIESDNNSVSRKLVFTKLAKAYQRVDKLKKASSAYEKLFEYDRRDFRTALEIVKINSEIPDFAKAITWADKAITIAPYNGETYAAKGEIYYKAFQECRSDLPNLDDKIIAGLANKYLLKAEENEYFKKKPNREWLEKYELVFDKTDWFMLDTDVKQTGEVKPSGSCYDWVEESLKKQPGWK